MAPEPPSGIMHTLKDSLLSKLRVPIGLWMLYAAVYGLCGTGMNALGTALEIARFTHGWQIITVYILYMVPISVLLRGLPWFQQYAYGLVAMGFLEFAGYALETSYAYPNNILDQLFGIRNFALSMSLFFALYFPAGNALVGGIYHTFFLKQKTGIRKHRPDG